MASLTEAALCKDLSQATEAFVEALTSSTGTRDFDMLTVDITNATTKGKILLTFVSTQASTSF